MPTHYAGNRTEVRALDAFIKLMRAANSVSGRINAELAQHDLTSSQFGVLETLYHLGPMCQKELADKLLVTGGNMTMVIDNLEKRHLAVRQRDAQDRRFVTVSLTASGRHLMTEIFPRHVARIVQMMSALTAAEQDELGRLCRVLGKAQRA
ncbi:MAG: MarR family winged helix-turn-helix transcriptional regulator [Candidatus Xenobia bacterium]